MSDISFHHTQGSIIVMPRDREMSGIDTSTFEDGNIFKIQKCSQFSFLFFKLDNIELFDKYKFFFKSLVMSFEYIFLKR